MRELEDEYGVVVDLMSEVPEMEDGSRRRVCVCAGAGGGVLLYEMDGVVIAVAVMNGEEGKSKGANPATL